MLYGCLVDDCVLLEILNGKKSSLCPELRYCYQFSNGVVVSLHSHFVWQGCCQEGQIISCSCALSCSLTREYIHNHVFEYWLAELLYIYCTCISHMLDKCLVCEYHYSWYEFWSLFIWLNWISVWCFWVLGVISTRPPSQVNSWEQLIFSGS